MIENFFIDDKFYGYIEDLIEDVLDWEGVDTIEELKDDWTIEVNDSVLEPIFKLSIDWIIDRINDDRLPDDCERTDLKLVQALKNNINFDGVNSEIPELYYKNWRSKITITKQDLL